MNIKSVVVLGRKWRDKVNGNTYHSARVLVDGKLACCVPFQYGYGSQFEWNAGIALGKTGIIGDKLGEHESNWRWLHDRLGIEYVVDEAYCSKKECIRFGKGL